ncbi:MAG: hypothetical protein ACRYGP_09330 [Janthinobacterium lividum]
MSRIGRGAPQDGLAPRRPDDKMVAIVGTRAEQAAAALRVTERLGDMDRVVRVGRDGAPLRTRTGNPDVLGAREEHVLVALSVRPVPGFNVNAAPVDALEVMPEPANADVALPPCTIGQAWRDAPLVRLEGWTPWGEVA